MHLLVTTRRTLATLVLALALTTVATFTPVNVQVASAVQADGCPPRALCEGDGADVEDDADVDSAPASDTDTKDEEEAEAPTESSITRYGKILIAALGTGMVIVAGWN